MESDKVKGFPIDPREFFGVEGPGRRDDGAEVDGV
jgi:hypothetical protein